MRRDPPRTGILVDFDGSLAPIVEDPGSARPLPESVAALRELARRYGVVAVVSGRPAAFLQDRLRLDQKDRLRVYGLYGAEEVNDATVRPRERADPALSARLHALATRISKSVPGARVEEKGRTLALHWREHPEAEASLVALARELATREGLELRAGRRSLELFAPGASTKYGVVAELVEGLSCACFLGDDEGDLAAFDALEAAARSGLSAVKVAVRSPESPGELLARADLVVDGPRGAAGFLEHLCQEL